MTLMASSGSTLPWWPPRPGCRLVVLSRNVHRPPGRRSRAVGARSPTPAETLHIRYRGRRRSWRPPREGGAHTLHRTISAPAGPLVPVVTFQEQGEGFVVEESALLLARLGTIEFPPARLGGGEPLRPMCPQPTRERLGFLGLLRFDDARFTRPRIQQITEARFPAFGVFVAQPFSCQRHQPLQLRIHDLGAVLELAPRAGGHHLHERGVSLGHGIIPSTAINHTNIHQNPTRAQSNSPLTVAPPARSCRSTDQTPHAPSDTAGTGGMVRLQRHTSGKTSPPATTAHGDDRSAFSLTPPCVAR